MIHSHFISSFSYADSKRKKRELSLSKISPFWKLSSPSLFLHASVNTNRNVHLLKIAVSQRSAELWTQWLCYSTSSILSCRRSFQKESFREEAASRPGAGRKASYWPRGWWHPPAEWISLGEVVGALIWVYVHKLVEFWQQVDPSNRRDLQAHQANTPALHFCFGGNSRPFLLPQSTLTVSQNESFPPNSFHYITLPCNSLLCLCVGLLPRQLGLVDWAYARYVWWSVPICCAWCFCCSYLHKPMLRHGKCPAHCFLTALRSIRYKVRISA